MQRPLFSATFCIGQTERKIPVFFQIADLKILPAVIPIQHSLLKYSDRDFSLACFSSMTKIYKPAVNECIILPPIILVKSVKHHIEIQRVKESFSINN